MKKRLLALLAIITIFANSIGLAVNAQTTATVGPGNGFRVSPVREELTIQPGKSETVDVAVENVTNENIVAHPVVNDFVASDTEDGQPRLLLDDSKPSSGNSFKTLVGTIPDLPLKPHERKTIKVTINVPANAAGGGYYGAVRFSPADGGDPKQVALTASVGVLFLVKVPGQIIEKLDLATLTAARNGTQAALFTASPDKIIIRLSNPGTIHLQPNGRVRVKNWRGKILSDQEFNGTDPRGNVLPNSVRHFEMPLGTKATFGRYTIEANLGYGTGGGDLIIAKANFWVIPLWFIIVLALLAAAAASGIILYRRKRRKQRRYR